MWRGTTPTHVFSFPEEYADTVFSAVYVTYYQDGKTVLEKTGNSLSFLDNTVTLTLTQEETLLFSEGQVKIQIRARTAAGTAVASNIISTTANAILKDGVI